MGDIIYILTQKNTLYLAVFIDKYSRKVISWFMGSQMKVPHVIYTYLQTYKKEHPKNKIDHSYRIKVSVNKLIFLIHTKKV
ncbi:DDE-type integrase/transposase/recombinase [Bacillus sp. IBL03825]|uniref:DDE-type integrase/transposase/recombinase n=1 Tax=Bacillus sp. IBL03825 TaxID=2953580 RepID=UPI0035BE8633